MMMMNEKEKSLSCRQTGEALKQESEALNGYYITIFSGITSMIACANITGLWSGVIAMLCTMIAIWMVYEKVGGMEDESEKA